MTTAPLTPPTINPPSVAGPERIDAYVRAVLGDTATLSGGR